MDAKEQFSKISAQYDSQRRNLIPEFDGFYGAAVDALDLPPNAKVADLGAGTGIMAAQVLRRFPDARFELVDVSDKMLALAKKRFADFAGFLFVLSDFDSWTPQGEYDAVVSALAIHHIEDSAKLSLYKKIFGALKDGGMFVNAEQVLGATPEEIKANSDARLAIVEKFMNADEAAVALERLKLDKCATIAENLAMLSEAGFSECVCVFSHLDFAVLAAKK